MARPVESNKVLKIENGVSYVDVSTSKYPNAVMLLDESDVPKLLDGKGRWHAVSSASSGPYAVRNARGQPLQSAHRVLLGVTTRAQIGDHKNHNGLDNRRDNLRPATSTQNARNVTSHADGTSRFLGVWWDKSKNKWRAGIRCLERQERHSKLLNLGNFDDEEEAARAYDKAAAEHFGTFANLNFPPEAVAA